MTFPESGSILVDPDVDILVTFSEAVNRGSFAEALFISPPPAEKPRIKWRGKTARIRLPESVPSDQTVLVTVGTGLKDIHNNSLESSYSFAFTTGERLIDGKVNGLMFSSDRIQGMLVGAWIIDEDSSVDPSTDVPQYVTQVGENNEFNFRYLRQGLYRILGWEDKDRDRLYNPATDKLGIPCRDIPLAEDGLAWIDLFPVKRDTGAARALFASAPDRSHALLRFSRFPGLHPDSIKSVIRVNSPESTLPVISAWIDAADSSRIVVRTAEQVEGMEYSVTFPGDTVILKFQGTSNPDTAGPVVSAMFPTKTTRDLPDMPQGWFAFNDALREAVWDTLLILTAGDSSEIPLKISYNEPNRLAWRALRKIDGGKRCRLTLDLQGIADASGNYSADSAEVIVFTVRDPARLGKFSGRTHGGVDPVFVSAMAVTGRKNQEFTCKADKDGNYRIENLLPGRYILWGFSDANGNGTCDFGSLDPFVHSERFAVNRDTVQVRERWETSGVDIYFR